MSNYNYYQQNWAYNYEFQQFATSFPTSSNAVPQNYHYCYQPPNFYWQTPYYGDQVAHPVMAANQEEIVELQPPQTFYQQPPINFSPPQELIRKYREAFLGFDLVLIIFDLLDEGVGGVRWNNESEFQVLNINIFQKVISERIKHRINYRTIDTFLREMHQISTGEYFLRKEKFRCYKLHDQRAARPKVYKKNKESLDFAVKCINEPGYHSRPNMMVKIEAADDGYEANSHQPQAGQTQPEAVEDRKIGSLMMPGGWAIQPPYNFQ
ncbi:unnamed protein product [Caenorhabditis auriculariae]|uniref:Uncharacterized protein n=1 Tax=Caenorhabditis auriculariae TaxID=2777116 RepID=A0A8S1HKZ5_9PELO|nr:unnamed protein product [Caenorhabditis auriculariae]